MLLRRNDHEVIFFVEGIPQPQGSKRAFHNKSGRIVLVEQSRKVYPWRDKIRGEATKHWELNAPTSDPVHVALRFYFKRPKKHYLTHGLRPNAPRWHVTRPDADKLARAVLDALTGVIYGDDSQVAELTVSKEYNDEKPGVLICVQHYGLYGPDAMNGKNV